MEHSFDAEHAKFLGLDIDPEILPICQPETAEEAIEIIELSCKYGAGIVVLDSVGGLVTVAELEGSNAAAPVARLMSNKLRGIIQHAKASGTCVVFINQIRKKVGVLFGSPDTTCGGEALKFFASMRIEVRKVGWLKTTNKVVGFKGKIKVVKNKIAPPYREAYFNITFDKDSPDLGGLENMILSGKAEKLGGGYYKIGDKKFKASTFVGVGGNDE